MDRALRRIYANCYHVIYKYIFLSRLRKTASEIDVRLENIHSPRVNRII